MATFIQSQKRKRNGEFGRKLVYEGQIYVKKKEGAGGQIHWECELMRTDRKCPGRAITDAQNVVVVTVQHNHAASPTRIEVKKVMNSIKQASTTSEASARAIVNQSLAGISDHAKVALPKPQTMEKAVYRKRRAIGGQEALPHSLAEIEIPNRLRRTRTTISEEFVLFDSGPEDNGRIIIFGSMTDLARLAASETWIIDGTFQSSPDLFYQLWTIHGKIGNKVVPLVYSLLPGKQQETKNKKKWRVIVASELPLSNQRRQLICIN